MGIHYSHLSNFERCRLFEWYHYQKKSIREVARLLNRSHATISREIRRNKSYHYVPTYYPHPAQFHYEQRMRERAQRIKLKSIEAQQYVVAKLELGWTPEIIAGRIKLETPYGDTHLNSYRQSRRIQTQPHIKYSPIN